MNEDGHPEHEKKKGKEKKKDTAVRITDFLRKFTDHVGNCRLERYHRNLW